MMLEWTRSCPDAACGPPRAGRFGGYVLSPGGEKPAETAFPHRADRPEEPPACEATACGRGDVYTARGIFRLTWPLLLEQLFLVLIGVVNTVMSSNIGAAAVSAVSYIDAFNQLIIAGLTAVATGATVIIAQYTGAGDREKAGEAASQSVLLVLLVSAAVAALLLLFGRPITGLLLSGTEPRVLRDAYIYLICSAVSMPFFGVYSCTSGILRGYGRTGGAMQICVMMNVVNIAVGGLLIYGLHFDVLGVGIALICARAAGAGISLWIMLRGRRELGLESVPKRLDFTMQRTLLKVGLPVAVENVLFYAGRFLTQSFVVGMGTVQMSAYAVTNSIISLVAVPGMALSFAAVTVVGKCVGAGCAGECRKHLWRLALICSGVWALLFTGLVPLPGLWGIIGLYAPTPEAAEIIWQSLAVYLGSAVVFWAPTSIFSYGFKGAGDVRFTTVVTILAMFAVRVWLGYYLGVVLSMGTLGCTLAMCFDWVLRGGIFTARFFQGGWQKKGLVREAL